MLGSPESSGWKVARLLLTCVADRVSLETGAFVASRLFLCVSLVSTVKTVGTNKKGSHISVFVTLSHVSNTSM